MKMFHGSSDVNVDVPEKLNDHLIHEMYSDFSSHIEQLQMLLTGYVPEFFDAYVFFRSHANKIFLNFLSQIEQLQEETQLLDNNLHIQGTLF